MKIKLHRDIRFAGHKRSAPGLSAQFGDTFIWVSFLGWKVARV